MLCLFTSSTRFHIAELQSPCLRKVHWHHSDALQSYRGLWLLQHVRERGTACYHSPRNLLRPVASRGEAFRLKLGPTPSAQQQRAGGHIAQYESTLFQHKAQRRRWGSDGGRSCMDALNSQRAPNRCRWEKRHRRRTRVGGRTDWEAGRRPGWSTALCSQMVVEGEPEACCRRAVRGEAEEEQSLQSGVAPRVPY